MFNLQETITDVQVGPAIAFGGLAIFPLTRENPVSRDYLTLTEAFKEKGVEVSEVSEGGSVPELLFKNLLDKDVFAADGETLLGAKQNRVLNSSIYVNAKSEVTIPVSCVEQGRWSYRDRNFSDCRYSEFVASRASKVESVSESLRASGYMRRSNQGAVWQEMASKRTDFGADAPTGSMSDIYDAQRPTLDRYVESFRKHRGQVGLACAIDGRVVGFEMFEEKGVYSQFREKLIRAYASEVIGKEMYASIIPERDDVRHLLTNVATLKAEEYPGVGIGTELRYSSDRLNGAALTVDDRLLHMVLLEKRNRRM